MKRFLGAALAALALLGFAAGPGATDAPAQPSRKALPNQATQPLKVLRYAFRVAETSFDPSQINDLYSRTVTPHIFEALYAYDHLARPAKFRPLTAEALPEHSDDWRTWTMRVRPGIYFADDPAFGGKKRELTAEDYVFSIKRFADPARKSPAWGFVDTYKLLGLAEARQRAIDGKKPFDYDGPLEGLRALDRYTLQIKLAEARPRFIEFLAASDLFGALAREVVQAHGDHTGEHPVGTGPFRLAQWRRGNFIALERNPDYRESFYDAEPAADDAEGQALLARFKGRRLPMIDRVEISIIEENQPRWLAFLNGEHNFIELVPSEYANLAMPKGKVAPNLAKQGVQGWRRMRSDNHAILFNLDDPLVGGYTPDKVALRRAIALGLDVAREIRLVHKSQAVLAQGPLIPNTNSFDPNFRSEMGAYDPARAQALLDLYGYVDRDGDGWRDRPDGAPLELQWSISSDGRDRQMAEQYQRDMKALQLKVNFRIGQWPELLKAARAGSFQIWHVGNMSASPDSQGGLQRYDSAQIGGQNMARFRRPEFDALYRRLDALPDGPERDAVFLEAERLAVVWMPYRTRWHSLVTDLARKDVHGYRRPLFWQEWWQYVDVDPAPAGQAR
ncbi:MAG TPA: ABC transporter substrate-binding protein [Ideonella sp.]|jgi:ABC-type transport system substrate-binding protein|nr:ABC transporter substrate-binding protein [Ideonella sp.]